MSLTFATSVASLVLTHDESVHTHADIAYTLGEYMTKKLGTPIECEHLNIANLKVAKGLVAQTDTSRPQLIRITASTSNVASGIDMRWHNVDSNGATEPEPFATATVLYGNADEYLRSAHSPPAAGETGSPR